MAITASEARKLQKVAHMLVWGSGQTRLLERHVIESRITALLARLMNGGYLHLPRKGSTRRKIA